jgi:hypothetical protein
MRNNEEFLKLTARYKEECKITCQSTNLEEVENNYTNADSTLHEMIDFAEANSTPDELENNLRGIDVLSTKTWIMCGGIPNWDDSFDAVEQYDTYENYFQRYGCFGVDCLVSWDENNIVVNDGFVTQMVTRPDVLMGVRN